MPQLGPSSRVFRLHRQHPLKCKHFTGELLGVVGGNTHRGVKVRVTCPCGLLWLHQFESLFGLPLVQQHASLLDLIIDFSTCLTREKGQAGNKFHFFIFVSPHRIHDVHQPGALAGAGLFVVHQGNQGVQF